MGRGVGVGVDAGLGLGLGLGVEGEREGRVSLGGGEKQVGEWRVDGW